MKKYCFIILVLLFAGQIAAAGDKEAKDPNDLLLAKWDVVIKDPNDPNKLLKAKLDAVIELVKAEGLDIKVKEDLIDKIVSPLFDFQVMAKLALGKKNWLKFTPAQRVKYSELFVKRLKDSYRGKIQFFEDQDFLFKPVVHKKNTIQIPMQMKSEGKKFDVVYKYRQAAKRWKIYDVEIQGVSLILTYRSQIDDVLKHGTVDDLMAHLKKVPAP